MGEGTHFKVPWLQMPNIMDIRTRPRTISSVTGTKGTAPCLPPHAADANTPFACHISHADIVESDDVVLLCADLQMVNISMRVLSKPTVSKLPDIFKVSQRAFIMQQESIIRFVAMEQTTSQIDECGNNAIDLGQCTFLNHSQYPWALYRDAFQAWHPGQRLYVRMFCLHGARPEDICMYRAWALTGTRESCLPLGMRSSRLLWRSTMQSSFSHNETRSHEQCVSTMAHITNSFHMSFFVCFIYFDCIYCSDHVQSRKGLIILQNCIVLSSCRHCR